MLVKNKKQNTKLIMCAKKGEKILECIYVPKDKQLTLKIAEEIDEHTTEKLRRKIDNEITRFLPRKVIFDFSNVAFMDSAGIGMLLGRYKVIKMLGGQPFLCLLVLLLLGQVVMQTQPLLYVQMLH